MTAVGCLVLVIMLLGGWNVVVNFQHTKMVAHKTNKQIIIFSGGKKLVNDWGLVMLDFNDPVHKIDQT